MARNIARSRSPSRGAGPGKPKKLPKQITVGGKRFLLKDTASSKRELASEVKFWKGEGLEVRTRLIRKRPLLHAVYGRKGITKAKSKAVTKSARKTVRRRRRSSPPALGGFFGI